MCTFYDFYSKRKILDFSWTCSENYWGQAPQIVYFQKECSLYLKQGNLIEPNFRISLYAIIQGHYKATILR